jgi:hypothetical protein
MLKKFKTFEEAEEDLIISHINSKDFNFPFSNRKPPVKKGLQRFKTFEDANKEKEERWLKWKS